MVARSLYISLISEMDCTMERISFSLSSIITVLCSTNDICWEVKPWRDRQTDNPATHKANTLVLFELLTKSLFPCMSFRNGEK